ncbi:F-actin-monooxygenase MICAL3-like [Clytia hemisphaerica]|uniref:MICAL-like protein 1 n=1 Tax=Clytia hemisphaerica TaxID=252671 RepID=A0A7M6DNE4_9CNID
MFATGTKGLLVWCKQITSKYGSDVEVKNMTTSFKNGMAFCAIIHHFRPDLIDFKKLSKENIAENNALAFRIAEDELDIPALLDVEDMVNMKVPDKLSIMTYVSQYYNYFKDKVPGEIEIKKYGSKKRTLAKDKHEVIPNKKSNDKSKQGTKMSSQKSNVCCLCEKKVFLMERLTVESKLFHRICFKCCVCNIQLKTSTYEYDRSSGMFFCAKDFKNKATVRQEPIGSERSGAASPLSNISENSEVTEIPKIADNPFKRNEQFVRKGIRPQSSPSDIEWEKTKVVKSKTTETKSEKPVKSGKLSFPGLKKSKKKAELDPKDFHNPSYQQQLELSNFMHSLDAKTTDPNMNERVVVGSEGDQTFDEQRAGTLSGLQVTNAQPVQKFQGETELDSKTSAAISGKSPKKKKLIFNVKKKLKGSKKNKDSSDGPQNEQKDLGCDGETCNQPPQNAPNMNFYTEFKAEKTTEQKNTSANYENIEHFRGTKNEPTNYESEEEVYENDPRKNENSSVETMSENEIGVYQPRKVTRKLSEDHYKVPMKIISDPTTQKDENAQSDSDDLRAEEDISVAGPEYQSIRSKLKTVENKECIEKDINEKRTDTSVGESYLLARSKLRSSNHSLKMSSPEPSISSNSIGGSKGSIDKVFGETEVENIGSSNVNQTDTSVILISDSDVTPKTDPVESESEISEMMEVDGEGGDKGMGSASNPFGSSDEDEEEAEEGSIYSSAQDILSPGEDEEVSPKNEEVDMGTEEGTSNTEEGDIVEVASNNGQIVANNETMPGKIEKYCPSGLKDELLNEEDELLNEEDVAPTTVETTPKTVEAPPKMEEAISKTEGVTPKNGDVASHDEDITQETTTTFDNREIENAVDITTAVRDCSSLDVAIQPNLLEGDKKGSFDVDMEPSEDVVHDSNPFGDSDENEDENEEENEESSDLEKTKKTEEEKIITADDESMEIDDETGPTTQDEYIDDTVTSHEPKLSPSPQPAREEDHWDGSETSIDKKPSPQPRPTRETSSNPFDDTDDELDEIESSSTSSKQLPKELNPFLSSDDEADLDESFDASNPFAEDLRAERSGKSRQADEYDETNPFAEDAWEELQEERAPKPFQRNQLERMSQKDRERLNKIGVDESNPFAEDLLEDEQITEYVPTKRPESSSGKKMVLKTKGGRKVRAAPAPPKNTSPAPRPQSSTPPTVRATPQPTPRSTKKRAAPKAPERPSSPPVALDPTSSLRRSLKKRPAPRPPQQLPPKDPDEIPSKPPRRESSKTTVLPPGVQYCNVSFEAGNLKIKDSNDQEGASSVIDEKTELIGDENTMNSDQVLTGSEKASSVDLTETESNLHENEAKSDNESESFSEDIDSNENGSQKLPPVEQEDEEEEEKSEMSFSQDTENEDENEQSEGEKRESVSELEDDLEEKEDSIAELPTSITIATSEQQTPVRKISEKRKAPTRPPQPARRLESLGDNEVEGSIALRDKQPRRKEIEIELRELEEKQRGLELEGVAMEKKLRELGDDEPEDAYLLTWFDLVNQKNLLLRKENELIYMSQELDLLQSQRHAEFELRQLMMKSEHEKSEADRDREEVLLSEILKMVTERSNIVEKMDEDRLREHEEDEEVLQMMQAQGLKSTPSKDESPVSADSQQQTKTKKEKKKKEKKEKKTKKK